MNDLKVFDYGEKQVRTVLIENEPWRVLTDVCKVLGISNARNAAARLDADEKDVRQMDALPGKRGGAQRVTVVNESGLYSVILRSDKPEAKKFKRWITHEVLPAIRKTGAYATPAWTPPKVIPVAVPVEPELSIAEQLKRAELLLRAADFKTHDAHEQQRLVDLAVLDLTDKPAYMPKVPVSYPPYADSKLPIMDATFREEEK